MAPRLPLPMDYQTQERAADFVRPYYASLAITQLELARLRSNGLTRRGPEKSTPDLLTELERLSTLIRQKHRNFNEAADKLPRDIATSDPIRALRDAFGNAISSLEVVATELGRR